MMRIGRTFAALLLAVGLAACGGGAAEDAGDTTTDAAGDAAAGEVVLTGLDNLQWEEPEKEAELADGSLDVTITCEENVPHNVVIEGVADEDVIAECDGGETGTGTVELEPGTYTYFCDITGHREAGMEGELTVS